MWYAIRAALTLASAAVIATPAPAHYNMLLPQTASAKRGEPVTFLYLWGHPYEHQLFDAPSPQNLTVLAPDGKKTDLTKSLEKTTVATAEGKKAAAYRFRFTPEQRGDYVFVLNTPPIWMEEEKEFFQDTVKVVLHVQAQKGWDTPARQSFEVLPLTRPYGLQPGMAFQAQLVTLAKPLAGSLVEVERYNAAAPKELPPDEHITRTAKTDPNGVVTCTLTDPGWWCLTGQNAGGEREYQGKPYPVRQRSTLWVFVDKR
jgi:cobalt/nickel transport protein